MTSNPDDGPDEGATIDPQDRLSASTADPVNNPAGDGVRISENAVAQGRTGTHTVRILGASLLLVILALFGMYFFHLGPLSTNKGAGGQSGTNSHADANQFHTDTSAPKQAPAGMPDSRAPAQ